MSYAHSDGTADIKLMTALANPDAVDAAHVIDAIRAGAHPETPIYYDQTQDVPPLVMAALLRDQDGPRARIHRSRIIINLLDAGADAAVAATRLLQISVDALAAGDLPLVRRIAQAQHALALELVARQRPRMPVVPAPTPAPSRDSEIPF